jgi:translation initiation factor IF-2
VQEVKTGFECGIGISGFDDLQEGDVLEFYRRERVS